MGYGLEVTCKNCGAQEDYTLGVGMAYFPLERVLHSVVPKRHREKVLELLKIAGDDGAEYSHTLFRCPKCETLNQRFYIRLSRGNETLFETKFRCGKCRSALMPISDEDVPNCRCSSCGSKSLERECTLMWD